MAPMGKFYYIVSKMNGKVLHLKHKDEDAGTAVVTHEKQEGEPDHQLWYDDYDTMTIRSKVHEMCLTLDDGELCVDEYDDGNDKQKWIFRKNENIIVNGEDGDWVLDIKKADDDDNAKIVGWESTGADNQLWECERVFRRCFMVRSRMNGMVMDIKKKDEDEGAKVIMWEETGEDNQLWWEDDHNCIRSKLTGFALQVDVDDNGDQVKCYEFDEGNENQHWMRAGNGCIVNRFQREKALDVEDGEDEEGAKVIVWERHGEDNQQFDFEYKAEDF